MTPLRTGLCLATTVGLFYALCTLAWVIAPAPFLGFMANLFHGMRFEQMVPPGARFDGAGFLMALVVLALWAFFAGTFFGWLARRLAA